MDETLKKLETKTIAELFFNIVYDIESELSRIEDMVCDSKYSDLEVVEEIQLLRSKLV